MKQLLIFLCLSITFQSFTQTTHLLDTTDLKKREDFIKKYENKYEIFNKNLKKEFKGKMKNEVLNFYDLTQKKFINILNKEQLLFNDSFQNYTDSLASILITRNPEIKNENLQIFISKHSSPNALCLGDGTLILHLGLFNYLENENQLLSVISHEIGHQLLKHTKTTIEEKAKINTTVLSKKSNIAQSFKKNKYNRNTKAFGLLKDLLYTAGETHREYESQADSIGYVIYKNTGLPPLQFIGALEILAQIDSLPSAEIKTKTYKTFFNLPEQQFDEKWLVSENFESYNYDMFKDKINKDSIKSHPDIEERISRLKKNFTELNIDSHSDIIPNSSFLNLKEIAFKSEIENLHYLNEYGLSVYSILKKLETDSENEYYKQWLGKNFHEIYHAKKKYQLNRYVDRVSPKNQSESYQLFLNFIWNLKLDEIKTIANYYSVEEKIE
ncbi:M48 family metalloprotease [Urechidicola croceus]|uniref:Peptidase M48 domain-containing protein n=1 Tax=Urechidicola croceus TaxID=1850246 RepID=A0A1D8P3X0_9FLAO|nr:M48 family metalloprotease [Urechidicola croceus]AOW19268.1 hypothetical protein LPB138_00560 [Urechidicola croceus]